MEKEISKATLKRLPTYLAYLKSLPEGSSVNISATALAAGLHMGEVQVRKDLALVSSGGRPKIGYNRAALIGMSSSSSATATRTTPCSSARASWAGPCSATRASRNTA